MIDANLQVSVVVADTFFGKVTGWNNGVPSYGATFVPYQNGGFWDGLIESFAGAHDYLNSRHYYHPNGTGGLAGGEG